MKKALLLSVLLLALAAGLHAQAPQAVTLQSVLRDVAGRLVANQNIAVRLTLTQGSATGIVVYCETHAAVTNPYGLYSVLLGQGTPSQGVFSSIDWGNGPYFLTTEADPAGGTAYSLSVAQPLVSVPYALYADTAARVAQATTAADATHAANADHSTLSDNATNALYADTARYYHERQVLTLGHDTIYLTGGSYVVLPPCSSTSISNNYIDSVIRANNTTVVNRYVDSVVNARNTTVVNNIQNQISDSVRQIQTLLRDSIIIRHSDSSHTAIYSDTALYYQERQVLSIGHDTIYLTGGSYVVLPAGNGSTVSQSYVDSVVNARNTTVVNNIQNQISDSVRQIQTLLRDSIIIRHCDSSHTAIYSDTARYYQERQVLSIGHDTIYLTGGSYVVLPAGNGSTVSQSYVDSVVNARNTTVVNNIQNQISDSVRQMQTLLRDSIIIRHCDSSHTAIYSDTARYYQERQVLSIGHDTIYLTGGSYVVLPNDSVVGLMRHYTDSSITANNTTVVSNIQNQISDSVQRMQTLLRDSIIIRHSDSSHTAIYSDTARYYQERQVLSIGHDTIYLTGGSYVVLPAANPVGVSKHYVDSSITANNTTVINNVNTNISDSVRFLYDSVATLMRDSVVAIIRDSAISVQQTISAVPSGVCYARCSSLDSLRHINDSITRAMDSIVHQYDSIVNVLKKRVDTVSTRFFPTKGNEEFVNGVLPGVFSVSDSLRVKFSQGNLQYNTNGTHTCSDGTSKQGTWRFAEHQYDYIGATNSNISSSYIGWIDLFGWATSGFRNSDYNCNSKYQPYSFGKASDCSESNGVQVTGSNNSGYGPSSPTSTSRSIYMGKDTNYDWGVFNSIINGGNEPGKWRSMTRAEWDYLLFTRLALTIEPQSGFLLLRFCKATINGITGLMIFPDYCLYPEELPLPRRYNNIKGSYSDNVYSIAQWSALERSGVVFLPAAGYRDNKTIKKICEEGHYWTSAAFYEYPHSAGFDYSTRSFSLNFFNVKCDLDGKYNLREYGYSVRLIQVIR